MTRQLRASIAGVLAAGVIVALGFSQAGTVPIVAADVKDSALPQEESTSISSYWSWKILRWDELIVMEANRRQLDPDFLASLVWMESRGDPQAVGPAGSVGLMQIMPKEAGFSWRPSRDVLMDPATNLFWGTRTLATVVLQGNGDIFNALAAYNGGWDKIAGRGPKIFATTILRDYAHAVAQRYALESEWIAYFAVSDEEIHGPIWIADIAREDVYLYGEHNRTPEGQILIPTGAPSAVVARFQDEETGRNLSVGVWIYDQARSRWLVPVPQVLPTPVMRSISVPPGEKTMLVATPEPVAAIAPVQAASADPVAPKPAPVASDSAQADLPSQSSMSAAAVSALMATGVRRPGDSVPASESPCRPGKLRAVAWPLERYRVEGQTGWTARIFVEGRAGDCFYTYAWNVSTDVRGENVPGPLVFEVTTNGADDVILGTVLVTSGDETVSVGVYITPP